MSLNSNDSEERQNVFAFNIKGDEIHISQAGSGRGGYSCMGCKREMQAMQAKTVKRISFFRHDPQAMKGQPKCTYSDETYRHKIAKEILQRIKRIKVPALYKDPPKGVTGYRNLIQPSKFIEAASVGIERCFYEDENCDIHWGRSTEVDEKHSLFRPDVTFFNAAGKPILLIEIIATHGIKSEKLIKIKRIGIDTIQVAIPKSSEEDIEKTFSVTEHTKWVYNYEYEQAEYTPVPNGNSEAVLPIDEIQRKLLEENFNCRTSEINNLIRSINRCLESKPFRDAEIKFREELQRVESNTARNRERLVELQELHRGEVEERFRIRRDQFEREEREFLQYQKDLESRYRKRKREQESERAVLENEIKRVIGDIEANSKSFERRRAELEIEEGNLREAFNREYARRDEIRRKKDELDEEIRTTEINAPSTFQLFEDRERAEIARISTRRGELQARFDQLHVSAREKFERIEEERRKSIESIENRRAELPNRFEEQGREIESRFEELRNEADRAIENQTSGGGSFQFAREMEKLIHCKSLLIDFYQAQVHAGRLTKAREYISSGSYKRRFEFI